MSDFSIRESENMSGRQELVSAKYIQDEVILEETRREGARSRDDCNQQAESFMIWGFFAVAMCAIVMIARSAM